MKIPGLHMIVQERAGHQMGEGMWVVICDSRPSAFRLLPSGPDHPGPPISDSHNLNKDARRPGRAGCNDEHKVMPT